MKPFLAYCSVLRNSDIGSVSGFIAVIHYSVPLTDFRSRLSCSSCSIQLS